MGNNSLSAIHHSIITRNVEGFYNSSLQPKAIINGMVLPFGQYRDDGEFHLIHKTIGWGGNELQAIYGVYLADYKYKIFIGECPTKNDDGVWVTTEKVPSFIISTFNGCEVLKKEPNVPHIIQLVSDEALTAQTKAHEKENNNWYSALYEAESKIVYCSLDMYIKGLIKRTKINFVKWFGRISRYNEHGLIYLAPQSWKLSSIQFHDGSKNPANDKFIIITWHDKSDQEWKLWIILKEHGRRMFRVRKEIVDAAEACCCGSA